MRHSVSHPQHRMMPILFFLTFISFVLADAPVLSVLAEDRLPSRPSTSMEQAIAQNIALATRISEYASGADALEAYHVQAEPMMKAGMAEVFDPHCIASVVIAVDPSSIDTSITGWGDLLTREVDVGIPIAQPQLEYISAALSYGLTGTYNLQAAKDYFNRLSDENRLSTDQNSPSTPVCLMLSDDVPEGWNIVYPVEGTLFFEKGIVWRRQADATIHQGLAGDPPMNAIRADATQLERFQPMYAYVRRTFLNERRFSTASGWEHQLSALISIIGISLWITYMNIRADSYDMRKIVTAIGCLQIGWVCARVAKYLCIDVTSLGRYLWYIFYIFQTAIVLLFFLLVIQLDKPRSKNSNKHKGLFAFFAALGGALVCLVLTNDLHQWAFTFPHGIADWNKAYGYGSAYYAILAYCYLLIAASVAILLFRCRHAPRRKGAVLSALVLVGLLVYSIGYILRYPLMWESDMTLITCWFILLFVESAFQSGLIPLSSGHKRLFLNTNLGMQLINVHGEPVLRTHDAIEMKSLTQEVLLHSGKTSHFIHDDFLNLYAAPIAGGHVVWQENVSELISLNRALDQTNAELSRQHEALWEEERIRGELASLNARNHLHAEVEMTISDRLSQIRNRLIEMTGMNETAARRSIARIHMLASAIKRSCGLLLKEKREEFVPSDDLAMALSEMAELTGYAGVQCVTSFDLTGEIPCAAARILYECFFLACEDAIDEIYDLLIVRLFLERNRLCLLMMTENPCLNASYIAHLRALMGSVNGLIEMKDLGDMHSISVICPLPGGAYA